MRSATRRTRTYRPTRVSRSAGRYYIAAVVSLISLIIIAAALIWLSVDNIKDNIEQEKDPHEGQVFLYDGFDWIWMTPLEGVPVNELTEADFENQNGQISYTGDKYSVLRGIDVSEHQKNIDWTELADTDIDYAYIRIGRRGYTEGGIFEDPYYEKNMDGAKKSGLKTGVYFFSQAISEEEAIEEANYVIEKLGKTETELPIVYDWEKIEAEGSRTADLTVDARTNCAIAFCETVKAAGYTPCIYFNRNIGYYGYDLSRLTDYEFWFSLPESGFPNFYYAVDMWQYSFTETVPGIEFETDMNLMFVPLHEDEALPKA